ncbi:MAG: hypothetical protein JST30_15950 [Armatimonadetes bacterium]|nr:hypothetical protein [Armatimonadota bacterium]
MSAFAAMMQVPMKFLCLGYLDTDSFDAAPDVVREDILTRCMAQCVPFRATGKVVAEEGVQHYRTAKTIRPQNGRPTVSDGPLFHKKEQLGSFFVIEAADIEEAVSVASLHPAAMFGEYYGFVIEVRPLQ